MRIPCLWEKLNIDKKWTLVNWCEFDKYAAKSYCAIHGESESKNLGDITEVDENCLEDFNLMTWGFPCTDISTAGGQSGFLDEDGNRTRSGMYYEGIRILRAKKPEISIIENVKNLVSKKFEKEFSMILSDLDQAGYNSYWKVLNAANYGIPQNRERIFIISIRKDIDNGKFVFPSGFELKTKWANYIDDEVEDLYIFDKSQYLDFVEKPSGNVVKTLGYMTGRNGRKEKHQSNTVYDINGLCPTLYAGLYKDPFRIKQKDKIRKITPKECFLLMGFSEEDYEKAKNAGVSKSQLYKQIGNSIVVDILYYIFKELEIAFPELFSDFKVSSFFSGIGAFEVALDKLYINKY